MHHCGNPLRAKEEQEPAQRFRLWRLWPVEELRRGFLKPSSNSVEFERLRWELTSKHSCGRRMLLALRSSMPHMPGMPGNASSTHLFRKTRRAAA